MAMYLTSQGCFFLLQPQRFSLGRSALIYTRTQCLGLGSESGCCCHLGLVVIEVGEEVSG